MPVSIELLASECHAFASWATTLPTEIVAAPLASHMVATSIPLNRVSTFRARTRVVNDPLNVSQLCVQSSIVDLFAKFGVRRAADSRVCRRMIAAARSIAGSTHGHATGTGT